MWWQTPRPPLVCANCQARLGKGATFCGRCGGKNLLTAREFESVEAREWHPVNNFKAAENLRQRAVARIAAMTEATACASCREFYDPPVAFCTSCGADIAHKKLSDKTIFAVLQRGFPQLLQSPDDVDRLRQSKPAAEK